jgi:hypothetical protein
MRKQNRTEAKRMESKRIEPKRIKEYEVIVVIDDEQYWTERKKEKAIESPRR